MYRVYFMGNKGQGCYEVEAESKEQAKIIATKELKGLTILTIKELVKVTNITGIVDGKPVYKTRIIEE